MAQERKEGHLERTTHEPRHPLLHTVILNSIDEINPNIRVYRLEIPEHGTVDFLPGQWVDLHVPTVPKPGGFTITSSPVQAVPSGSFPGYLELAIQRSPENPVAAWLWRPESDIINSELHVRVGGSFVWPPAGIDVSSLRKVVFVAGGMGINPMISMLSWLSEQKSLAFEVEVLYSVKLPYGGMKAERLLFVERIVGMFQGKLPGRLKLFVTNSGSSYGKGEVSCGRLGLGRKVPCELRRMTCDTCVDHAPVNDLAEAVGEDKDAAVVYVCGPPAMTDEFVAYLTTRDGLGMDANRVLFEKWW